MKKICVVLALIAIISGCGYEPGESEHSLDIEGLRSMVETLKDERISLVEKEEVMDEFNTLYGNIVDKKISTEEYGVLKGLRDEADDSIRRSRLFDGVGENPKPRYGTEPGPDLTP